MKQVNLEEILSEKLQPIVSRESNSYQSIEQMKKTPEWEVTISAMLEACNQAIDLCAENAMVVDSDVPDNPMECVTFEGGEEYYQSDDYTISVDKESILNTKKQII